MKNLKFLSFAALVTLYCFSIPGLANEVEKSVLTEALNLMVDARETHKNNRLRSGREIDEIFNNNLKKLAQREVNGQKILRQVSTTFLGDKGFNVYRIGDSMEIWVRKQTRGTGASLDAVYWEFQRDSAGNLIGVKGKGVDTYTVFNKDYSSPVHIDSRTRASLEPGILSKSDLEMTKRLDRTTSEMRRGLSHFGAKLTTGQHWVNDISNRLQSMTPEQIRKLNIPGVENLTTADIEKLHVSLLMDQKESFLWADRAKNAKLYDRLRQLDATRSHLAAEQALESARTRLNKASLAVGPEAAEELSRAQREFSRASSNLQDAKAYLQETEQELRRAGAAVNSQARAPTRTPRLSPSVSPSKLASRISTVVKGGGAVLSVAAVTLIAERVAAQSSQFNQAYVVNGVEPYFKQGRFRTAKAFWQQEVEGMQNAPATTLVEAITDISGIHAANFYSYWPGIMAWQYDELEKPARAQFEAYVRAIKSKPAKFSELALDDDLKVEILAQPMDLVFAGETVSITARVYVQHNFGDYGEYRQPVVEAPFSIGWNGQYWENRRVLSDAKGEIKADNFLTGEVVWDDSLGEQTDRTKLQAAYHELDVAIADWDGNAVESYAFGVQAYDYVISELAPDRNKLRAQSNGKDTIKLDLKLERRTINADGTVLLQAPAGYSNDFNRIAVNSGLPGSGIALVSSTTSNFRQVVEISPPEQTGLFSVYAISTVGGKNQLRLDLRGLKYRTYYMEVGKYAIDFVDHPLDYKLVWGPDMNQFLRGATVVLPAVEKGSVQDFTLDVRALNVRDNAVVEGAKLEFTIEPAGGVNLRRNYAVTDKNGVALDGGDQPSVWRVNADVAKITISAAGAANRLEVFSEAKGVEVSSLLPRDSGNRRNLLANGSFELGANPGAFIVLATGSTAISSWVVTRETIDYVGTYFSAAEGGRSVDLGGTPGNGGIQQSFTTKAGQRYTVRFALAGNPQCGGEDKIISVAAAGQKQFFRQPASLQWNAKQWQFEARAANTTLTFLSELSHGATCGALLDDVQVFSADGVLNPSPPAAATNLRSHLETRIGTYKAGEPIDVLFKDAPGNYTDWITIVPVDTKDDQWAEWYYLEGKKNGEQTFRERLVPGMYEVRLYYNWPEGSFDVRARYRFNVLPDANQ